MALEEARVCVAPMTAVAGAQAAQVMSGEMGMEVVRTTDGPWEGLDRGNARSCCWWH